MKNRVSSLILAAALALPTLAHAAYLQTIFQDPAHPRVSAGATFDSRLGLAGGVSAVAIVYHKADRADSLFPQRLLDAGLEPVAWGLNVGAGGSVSDKLIIPFGITANLTPTLLGPALRPMRQAQNRTVRWVANLIDGPSGGVAFGPQWTAHVVDQGAWQPVSRWRFPPGWFVGALWTF